MNKHIIIISLFLLIIIYPVNSSASIDEKAIERAGLEWLNINQGEEYNWEYLKSKYRKGMHKIKGKWRGVPGIEATFISRLVGSKILLFIYRNEVLSIIDEPSKNYFLEDESWVQPNKINHAKSYLKKTFKEINIDTITASKVHSPIEIIIYKKAYELGWNLGLYKPLYYYPIPKYISDSANTNMTTTWLNGVKDGYNQGFKKFKIYLTPDINKGLDYWSKTDSLTKKSDVIIRALIDRLDNLEDQNYYNFLKTCFFLEFKEDIANNLIEKNYNIITRPNFTYFNTIFPISEATWDNSKLKYVHKQTGELGEKIIVSNVKWSNNNMIDLTIDHRTESTRYIYKLKYKFIINKWFENEVEVGTVHYD